MQCANVMNCHYYSIITKQSQPPWHVYHYPCRDYFMITYHYILKTGHRSIIDISIQIIIDISFQTIDIYIQIIDILIQIIDIISIQMALKNCGAENC